LKRSPSILESNLRIAAKIFAGFLIAFINYANDAHAQTQSTPPPGQWLDNLVGLENSGVINGPEYRMAFLGASTNPFFTVDANRELIRYNDQDFYAPLLYDIYKDEVVIKYLSSGGRVWLVQLDKKLVREFTIQGRLFRNFNGLYREVLFDGDNLLLVSRKSKFEQTKNGIPNYQEHHEYFLGRSGKWKRVSGASAFRKMLDAKEDKQQLKLFLKQNRIKVGKFKDDQLTKVAAFVNDLRNKKS
jgi:hypothetical protein